MKGKSMKFIRTVLPLFIITVGILTAQDEGRMTPEERAKFQTEKMTEQLGLTPEQAEKIHAINLKYATQANEKLSEAKADGKKGKRGKGVKKHLKARDKEIQGVLNKEQKKKFKKTRKHQKDKMKDRQKKRKDRRQDRRREGSGRKPY